MGEKMSDRCLLFITAALVICGITFWATIAYVIAHFVIKYW